VHVKVAAMNEIAPHKAGVRTTQAAEGIPRWRWTTAELLRLAELGAFADEDRFELIGGEIVPMSPKGRRHEVVSDELVQILASRAHPDLGVSVERQFNLGEDTYVMPDLIVRPASIKTYDLRGPDALLVVQVSDTSLAYDSQAKALLYARHGVREYWVINAQTLETIVHRDPGETGYADLRTYAVAELMTPIAAPQLAVRLAELDFE
jgi:Uma2 family endonuclease